MSFNVLLPIPSSHQVGLRVVFIILGVLCCVSIIGLPFGIGFLVFASMLKKVTCPVCENDVLITKGMKAFSCFYCQKRLLVKKGVLTKV